MPFGETSILPGTVLTGTDTAGVPVLAIVCRVTRVAAEATMTAVLKMSVSVVRLNLFMPAFLPDQ